VYRTTDVYYTLNKQFSSVKEFSSFLDENMESRPKSDKLLRIKYEKEMIDRLFRLVNPNTMSITIDWPDKQKFLEYKNNSMYIEKEFLSDLKKHGIVFKRVEHDI